MHKKKYMGKMEKLRMSNNLDVIGIRINSNRQQILSCMKFIYGPLAHWPTVSVMINISISGHAHLFNVIYIRVCV